MKYKKLELSFVIPDYLEEEIELFLDHINNGSGSLEDCYRTEIKLMIRDSDISEEKKQLLRDYYVNGGIYNG